MFNVGDCVVHGVKESSNRVTGYGESSTMRVAFIYSPADEILYTGCVNKPDVAENDIVKVVKAIDEYLASEGIR